MPNFYKKLLPLSLGVYLLFAGLSAWTQLPGCDEAWFTLPGFNLLENGFFGTTVLDETATFRKVDLTGINQNTYWIMPIYPLFQGVVGKIAGFGLMQMRGVSLLFGLAAIVAWILFIKKFSGHSIIALITAGLLAVDYHFIGEAGFGRMDMMTASLGISSLAVFMWLRGENLNRAVLFSFTLSAVAFFTHPLGLMWAVSLAILIIFLDMRRLRFGHLLFAAAPFVIIGLCWSFYILQNPELFSKQFGGNASNRWGFLTAPFTELWRELTVRYLANFGVGDGLGGFGQIKVVILIIYVFSIIGILSVKSLRESKLPRFLIILAAQQIIMSMVLDGMKQVYYLVHIIPTLVVTTAIWLNWLISKEHFAKWAGIGLLMILVLAGVSINLSRFSQNKYHDNFLTAANILNQTAKPTDTIIASAEFWFALDKKENLVDDYRLGYLSGRKADIIVIDTLRYRDWINNLAITEPQTYLYIENLLQNGFEEVYDDKVYRLYRRK